MERALNPFEILFQEAMNDPAREADFFGWVSRQVFYVPCQLTSGFATSADSSTRWAARRVEVDAQTRLRLKAFSSQGQGGVQTLVPFFSDLSRFEKWSLPEPQGQYAELPGRTFFALVPPQAAALLNPGSERFSKWFAPDEVRRVLSSS